MGRCSMIKRNLEEGEGFNKEKKLRNLCLNYIFCSLIDEKKRFIKKDDHKSEKAFEKIDIYLEKKFIFQYYICIPFCCLADGPTDKRFAE